MPLQAVSSIGRVAADAASSDLRLTAPPCATSAAPAACLDTASGDTADPPVLPDPPGPELRARVPDRLDDDAVDRNSADNSTGRGRGGRHARWLPSRFASGGQAGPG